MINTGEHIIPDKKIVCVPEHPAFANSMFDAVEPLHGQAHRDGLGQHVFHCLPVVVGNQYGFAIRSLVSWTAKWNGGESSADTIVKIDKKDADNNNQIVASHFGSGIVTVQNRFHFRTAPGVNLMVLNAPNIFHFNLSNMFAVVETDNLRRDFTFNLKIVKPRIQVSVKKGDLISAIIPMPRYYVDDFELASAHDLFSNELIAQEQQQVRKFAKLRSEDDYEKPSQLGKLYWRGVDADENKFGDHQRHVKKRDWDDNDPLKERLDRLTDKDD